jgi:hypothetical protein
MTLHANATRMTSLFSIYVDITFFGIVSLLIIFLCTPKLKYIESKYNLKI